MNYSSYNSFINSKTNKNLLINLIDYIESEVGKDYENKFSLLKKEFVHNLNILKSKYDF